MYLEILPSLELFSTGEEFRRTDKINTVIPPMLKIPPIVKKWIETLQVLSKD